MSPRRHGTEVLSAEDQALLSQPLTLPFSGKVVKNRFCKAALSERLARSDGQIDEKRLNRFVHLYDAWASGGSGLILTGNFMVDRTMREM
jgi:2,4-dienoyl-CoA reductase-like NADH-dependent reductase (Old Yellow Enzyme family)